MIDLKILIMVLLGLQFTSEERAFLVEAKAKQQVNNKSIMSSFKGKFGKEVSKSQVNRIYKKFKT